ncbi:N-acetylglucosamine-6-sulfatase-like [Haliotis rufescens]|uniref:N-acetylglucosamine-6-sulfatase-like n=1 Tax=Haliotis rufescens TaxID=6454 RepID=UPI00201F20BB|nr:N-acetylglucosamine-6-sulfatase-like [Haliotis rufescens]
MKLTAAIFLLLVVSVYCSAQTPNIVFILTDDLDTEIGGMTPLEKTKRLIGDNGITFLNMFVTTPICCPSRASIFTGKYQHNHRTLNNTVDGGCSNTAWQQTEEHKAFPFHLQTQGYDTFFAGKYLNQYGMDTVGGVGHVPPGWSSWVGLVGNSVYYNYTLSVNGTAETHGHDYTSDYLTDVIHKRAKEFLGDKTNDSSPFFMMLSTPACHDPWEPAPQYESNFPDIQAPRFGSFNTHGKGKHWLIQQAITPMDNDTIAFVDDVYRRRWRTLLSVDDMVEDLVNTLEAKGLLANTFIFFSSDNGYHTGQFSMPTDKRLLYEFDVRVPLLVRGPGVAAGSKNEENVLNIDFGPTFVELAGGHVPDTMDGKSLASVLHNTRDDSVPFRTEFLTEYQGETNTNIFSCSQWENQGMAYCPVWAHCVCEDSWNNTYTCIRRSDGEQNMKFCQFADSESFEEMYDLSRDHYELMNIAKSHPEERSQLLDAMSRLVACNGASCRSPQANLS